MLQSVSLAANLAEQDWLHLASTARPNYMDNTEAFVKGRWSEGELLNIGVEQVKTSQNKMNLPFRT